MSKIEDVLASPESSIREVIECIDRNGKGIALIVDNNRNLIGTIADGDVRRGVLAGISLEAPASELLKIKCNSPYEKPITAKVGIKKSDQLELMQERAIRQLPLLDDEGHVVDLATLDDLMPEKVMPLQAVIMAGGYGTRLRPLTENTPKPMLPVGNRPLMEHIVTQLSKAGIKRLNITTHYKPEKITEYFGDGHAFGVDISYVPEDKPLGTAGALGLMTAPSETMLVMNGDILTNVDFKSMLNYHRELGADMTVGVRHYGLQVPYGVVECDGPRIRRLQEKPLINFFVNAGIYLLEPVVHKYIKSGQRTDMTDVVKQLIEEGHNVVSFPIVEYWLDIGQPSDYEQAQKDMKTRRGD